MLLYLEDGKNVFLRNVNIQVPDSTVSFLATQTLSSKPQRVPVLRQSPRSEPVEEGSGPACDTSHWCATLDLAMGPPLTFEWEVLLERTPVCAA